MKKIFALILVLVFVLLLVACDKNETTPTTNSTTSSTDDSSDYPNTPPDDNTQIGPSHKNEPDVDPTRPTVEGTLAEALKVFDAVDTFGNEGKVSSYTDYTNVDVSKLAVNKQYKIEKGGIYRIYGKSTNGQIFVQAKDQNVILLLDGVDLTYAGSAPAIYAEDCASVTIIVAENSQNLIADTDVNGENAAIRVRSCNLKIGGKGKLTVQGNAKNAIACTKEIEINGGLFNLTSVKHGIYGKLGVTINGGKFVINAARSGIKSGDDEIGNEAIGKIVINSGSLRIKCYTNGLNATGSVSMTNGRLVVESMDKAVVATSDINVSGGMMILSTASDAIKSDTAINVSGSSNIKITSNGNGFECTNTDNNGKINVSTTGVIYIKTSPVYEKSATGEYKLDGDKYVLIEGNESVYDRYKLVECKGFETDGELKISKGSIGINSFEDCINGSNVTVSGGKLYLASQRDAIDGEQSVTVDGTADVKVIASEKGFRSAMVVNLNAGTTEIYANTDAIKSGAVSVLSGTHILYEKVEVEDAKAFTVRGGLFLSVSTTNEPVVARCLIPNAYGTLTDKELCIAGKYLSVIMGNAQYSVVLPKDYTEKISVFFAAESQGKCTAIIGQNEKSQELTQGSFYN